MEPRNDLESLDIEVSNLNEDPFHDDYMTDEEASRRGWGSAWTRMKYWFYKNRLNWSNNSVIIREGKGSKDGSNFRRGIPPVSYTHLDVYKRQV